MKDSNKNVAKKKNISLNNVNIDPRIYRSFKTEETPPITSIKVSPDSRDITKFNQPTSPINNFRVIEASTPSDKTPSLLRLPI